MEGEKVIKNKTEDLILTCVLDSFPLKSFKWILPNGLEEILYVILIYLYSKNFGFVL